MGESKPVSHTSNTMKLSPLLTVAVVVAEQAYERCPLISADDLPAGVASVDCAGKKCKSVCEEGLVPMHKSGLQKSRAITCRKGQWQGELSACKRHMYGCTLPGPIPAVDDYSYTYGNYEWGDELASYACRVKKGVNHCKLKCEPDPRPNYETKLVANIQDAAGGFTEHVYDNLLKMTCRCPKNGGGRDCGWHIDTRLALNTADATGGVERVNEWSISCLTIGRD